MADARDDTSEPILTPRDPPDRRLADATASADAISALRQTILQSFSGSVPADLRAVSAAIHGPRGAGKRRLVKAVAGEFRDRGFQYDHVQSLPDFDVQPTEAMRRLLEETRDRQPIVVVLDLFDEHHVRSGTVRVFSEQMAAIRAGGDDVALLSVIDSTEFHSPDVMRFLQATDVVVNVERPDIDRRRRILAQLQERVTGATDAVDWGPEELDQLARATEKFGVDDLHEVGRRAVLTARTHAGAEPPLTEGDLLEIVEWIDEERVERVRDEYTLTDVDLPSVTFDDIGGLEEAKQKLTEQVRHAFAYPDLAAAYDIRAGGVLLHGPPGTGKTMLVRALANELDYTFIPVSCPRLKSSHRGGPASKIPSLFERAERNSPTILFFDEFDTIGGRRASPHADEAAVNTLLTELDGLTDTDDVVTIAATNLPDTLDPALLRAGRFDYHVEAPPPDDDAIGEIFATQTDDVPIADDVTASWFVELVDDVTGADIAAICRRAISVSLRRADDPAPGEVEITREMLRTAYEEFRAGRLQNDDGDSPIAFQ